MSILNYHMKTFLSSGSLGDIIFAIPSIRSIADGEETKLYLKPDVFSPIPAFAGKRQPSRMLKTEALSLIPLLESQGIAAELHQGQPVDYDLDEFRSTGFDFGRGHIGRYCSYRFKCRPNLWEPWLQVKEPSPDSAGKVLVNRTLRYHGKINYRFLQGKGIVFVGYTDEYNAFVKEVPDASFALAPNALTLARWLAGCKGFIGNQSFCFSLAEGLKIPRLMEVSSLVPNVVVQGPNGADAISQELFEEFAEEMLR